MTTNIKLPVNLPYYWKMVLAVASAESGFIDAGNNLLNDLFFDVLSYYYNCDIMTAQVFQKFNHRMIKLKYYDGTTTVTDNLYSLGFCVNDTAVGYSIKLNTGASKIASLADTFYRPKALMTEGTEYDTDSEGVTHFVNNIFSNNPSDTFQKVPWHYEQYTTPTGITIDIKACYMIATDISMQESPLYNNYGALVYTRKALATETEFEYRNKILGLFYLMYNGMTNNALNAAVNVMCGYPVTLHNNEKILNIDTDNNIILTEYRDLSGILHEEEYTTIPTMPLAPNIAVGSTYNKYTPFYDAVVIEDVNTTPDWIHGQELPEELYKTDYASHQVFDLQTKLPLVYQDSIPPGDKYIRFDTPGMIPFNDSNAPGGIRLSVYSWTYYVWHHFLKNAVCKISITTDTSAINVSDVLSLSFLDSVLPIWLYYLVDHTTLHIESLDTQTEDAPGYISEELEITT